jgi:hypothetical protein
MSEMEVKSLVEVVEREMGLNPINVDELYSAVKALATELDRRLATLNPKEPA